MLDSQNVCFVLSSEVVFTSLPTDLQVKIIGVIPEFLAQLGEMESAFITLDILVKAISQFTQLCLAKDFIPVTEATQVRRLEELDETIRNAFPELTKKSLIADEIKDSFPELKVAEKTISQTEDETISIEMIAAVFSEIQNTFVDMAKGQPVPEEFVHQMYPWVRKLYDAGQLTVGAALQNQPSLFFVSER